MTSPFVRLRTVTVADAEVIHGWRSQPSTAVHQPIQQKSLPEVRAMLAATACLTIGPNSLGKFQWIVLADDHPRGWISLEINVGGRQHGNGVVGYTVDETFRGRGIATKAVTALISTAFDSTQFDLHRLDAIASTANTASRRVLESNGFQQEGTLRGFLIIAGRRVDHATYGLLRTDWERTCQEL